MLCIYKGLNILYYSLSTPPPTPHVWNKQSQHIQQQLTGTTHDNLMFKVIN
jgi:hypothetical protein